MSYGVVLLICWNSAQLEKSYNFDIILAYPLYKNIILISSQILQIIYKMTFPKQVAP